MGFLKILMRYFVLTRSFPFLFLTVHTPWKLYVLNSLFGESRPIFKLIEEMQEYKELASVSFSDSSQIHKSIVTSAPKCSHPLFQSEKILLSVLPWPGHTAVSPRCCGPRKRQIRFPESYNLATPSQVEGWRSQRAPGETCTAKPWGRRSWLHSAPSCSLQGYRKPRAK